MPVPYWALDSGLTYLLGLPTRSETQQGLVVQLLKNFGKDRAALLNQSPHRESDLFHLGVPRSRGVA